MTDKPTDPADAYHRTEVRDGMKVTWHEPIEMDDGNVLRADMFQPIEDGQYPVILTYGAFGKGVAFQEGFALQWQKMIEDYPEVLEGSTNKYQNWEVTDPERWIPHDYVVIRVDSRGAGWSPGYMQNMSPREVQDVYACIEWAGTQPWSNGKVGMLGISYFARNQWRVAAKHPPHLAAIIPWEGVADPYRDSDYHGGILSEFQKQSSRVQVVGSQYGNGDRARKNPNTGESVAGPVTLPEEEVLANRSGTFDDIKANPLFNEFHQSRAAELEKIEVPLLSCANWGGQGIHPRGSFNGYMDSSSKQKWLEVHGDSHWSMFYTDYGRALQKLFFDHFLKGEDNGWDRGPKVMLNIRHPGEKFVYREEDEWPLARTQWTKFYLDLDNARLVTEPIKDETEATYATMGEGLDFWLPRRDEDMEIIGPMASKIFLSSQTNDADLFLIVRLFDPDGEEVTFMGSTDPNTPIANGWLRASQRRLDPEKSRPERPFHPHDRTEPLEPGEVYECDVEILTSCIVVPAGWDLCLSVRGKDYEYKGELSEFAQKFHYATRGTGGMTHNDEDNRPPAIFDTDVTLHAGGGRDPFLLLPVIPPKA
ncbi:MAG: CocE/NonD family hydrolase [Alphaproteobacteria bacterium]